MAVSEVRQFFHHDKSLPKTLHPITSEKSFHISCKTDKATINRFILFI